jgi:hypothetical protein
MSLLPFGRLYCSKQSAFLSGSRVLHGWPQVPTALGAVAVTMWVFKSGFQYNEVVFLLDGSPDGPEAMAGRNDFFLSNQVATGAGAAWHTLFVDGQPGPALFLAHFVRRVDASAPHHPAESIVH